MIPMKRGSCEGQNVFIDLFAGRGGLLLKRGMRKNL